jgi:tetratricopeptide (TPR) repeat protein
MEIFEELFETDIDFPNLRKKIDFLKGSNLASLQNKLICGVISNFENKKIIGLWSREVKSSVGKEKLDVSFAQNYLVTGFDYFIKGMYQAALDEFTLASQLDPRSIVCLNNLGLTLLVVGKLEEALSKFKNANFIQPNSAVILNNLALTYLLLKKINLSEDNFKKALELEKELSAGLINYGDLAYMTKNSQKAFDLYKKVSSSDVLYDVAASRMLYLIP